MGRFDRVTDSPDRRLANLVGALALGLADDVRHAAEAAAGETAAAPAAIVVLDQLLAGGTIDRLRRSVALTPSGGVRLVDRLVDAGYVARRPGADGRSVSLVLTPAGRRVAERVRAARHDRIERALAPLDTAERAELARLVAKVIGGVVTERLDDRGAATGSATGWLCRLCDPEACG